MEVWRNGQQYRQRFLRGVPEGDLQNDAATDRRGTRIHFLPDPDIFDGGISLDVLSDRLREQAFLHPGLSIELTDEASGKTTLYAYDTGIVGFVEYLNQGRRPVHPTFRF